MFTYKKGLENASIELKESKKLHLFSKSTSLSSIRFVGCSVISDNSPLLISGTTIFHPLYRYMLSGSQIPRDLPRIFSIPRIFKFLSERNFNPVATDNAQSFLLVYFSLRFFFLVSLKFGANLEILSRETKKKIRL